MATEALKGPDENGRRLDAIEAQLADMHETIKTLNALILADYAEEDEAETLFIFEPEGKAN